MSQYVENANENSSNRYFLHYTVLFFITSYSEYSFVYKSATKLQFFLISAKINSLFLPINRKNYYLCITINEDIL